MKNTFMKVLVGIIVVPVLSILGYMGYLQYLAPVPPEPEATANPEVIDVGPKVVSAEGKIVPHEFVQLSFNVPGVVEEVFAKNGDLLQSGDPIARLEGEDKVRASIEAAKLELLNAQIARDDLYEHLELQRAQAQQNVVEAQEVVNEAEKLLNSLKNTASEAQVEAAQAAVVLAEEANNRAKKELETYLERPEDNPKRAAAQLTVYTTERQYLAAVRYLNALQSTPDELDIARAESNLAVAQAQFDEAENNYETLLAGPDPDSVALAEGRVTNAEAQLAAVQASLEDLILASPIAGKVISLDLKVGEVVSPGFDIVTVADLSGWRVETTDLTENDVALLSPGMQAEITINAFPDINFTGTVEDIDQLGQERRGAVTYKVILSVDPEDAPLRWEMSAFIEVALP